MVAVQTVSATPTIDTNAYSAGDLVGTKMEFSVAAWRDGGGCILDQVLITDQAEQSADVDLILFGTDPSGTTFTNNAELDIADADLLKVLGFVSLTADAVFADNSLTAIRSVGLPIALGPTHDGTIYGALVSRGTPTYAAATDLKVHLTFRRIP